MREELPLLSPEFARMAAELDPTLLLRAMRNGLRAVARQLARMETDKVAASQPADRRRQIRSAMHGSLYRDLSAVRIYMRRGLRKYPGGYSYTGRPTQPWMPLAYWYEHGFTHPRPRRGRDRRQRAPRSSWGVDTHTYGSIEAWGRHIMQQGLDWAAVDALVAPLVEQAAERVLKRYGAS